MPFPRAPHPNLLQWDDYACDAAVAAQILFMGGWLNYPFDTTQFDRSINRQPGRPNGDAKAVQLIVRSLPVTLLSYGPRAQASYADPVQVGQSLLSQGYPLEQIEAYLQGPDFQLNQNRAKSFQQLFEELGAKCREQVGPNSSQYVRPLLKRGAIIATLMAGFPSSHAVLLIPRVGRRGTPITLYDPTAGLTACNLDHLERDGGVQFDQEGFLAYVW